MDPVSSPGATHPQPQQDRGRSMGEDVSFLNRSCAVLPHPVCARKDVPAELDWKTPLA